MWGWTGLVLSVGRVWRTAYHTSSEKQIQISCWLADARERVAASHDHELVEDEVFKVRPVQKKNSLMSFESTKQIMQRREMSLNIRISRTVHSIGCVINWQCQRAKIPNDGTHPRTARRVSLHTFSDSEISPRHLAPSSQVE